MTDGLSILLKKNKIRILWHIIELGKASLYKMPKLVQDAKNVCFSLK